MALTKTVTIKLRTRDIGKQMSDGVNWFPQGSSLLHLEAFAGIHPHNNFCTYPLHHFPHNLWKFLGMTGILHLKINHWNVIPLFGTL